MNLSLSLSLLEFETCRAICVNVIQILGHWIIVGLAFLFIYFFARVFFSLTNKMENVQISGALSMKLNCSTSAHPFCLMPSRQKKVFHKYLDDRFLIWLFEGQALSVDFIISRPHAINWMTHSKNLFPLSDFFKLGILWRCIFWIREGVWYI